MNFDEILNLALKIGGIGALGVGLVYGGLAIKEKISKKKEEMEPFFEIRKGGNLDDISNYEFDPVSREEIIGMDPILLRIDYHIDLLNNYAKFTDKIDMPKGIVLVGPPGVGKTYLSRYIFTKINGEILKLARESEFGGFKSITNLYEAARKKRDKNKKPVILFRDEIGKRSMELMGEGLQLLEELSGVNSKRNDGIFFLATTNQPLETSQYSFMDEFSPLRRNSPLYRLGRLEIIEILPPNLDAKANIFSLYLNKDKISYVGNAMDIASMIPFFQTGAFIKQVVDETIAKNEKEITDEDLLSTMITILLGNKQEAMLNDTQRIKVAKHEVGHYLIARDLGYKVAFVSVDCHSNSLGYAHLCPHESDILTKKEDLKNRIKIFMGGYITEMMESEENMSTGCVGDLEMVHRIYRYLYALENRGVDPAYLFHGYRDEGNIPKIRMPKEELKKFEADVKDKLNNYKDKIEPLAKLIASKDTLHSSELEKIIQRET